MKRLIADFRELWTEQIDHRELLVEMTKRDLLLRYKQTVMGFAWAVFMPLINTVVFSVIFTRVAPIDVGMPYPLFAFCGLLMWNFTASSLRFATNSLTGNINLVTKVYFPREIFPVSAVLVSLVDLAVGSVVLVGIMAWYGVGPSITLLALPAVIVVHVAFTTALALMLAMANLFYRDVKYLFEVLLTVWMFATAVLYPLEAVGGWWGRLLQLNPMTPVITAYRAVLLQGQWPPAAFGMVAVATVLFVAIAWVSFHRAEYQFAENI
jgi:lipopolysaccharide transport system permease protein